MKDNTDITGRHSQEATDSDLITYTQVACYAADDFTSRPQRLSLRARLEREREERAQRHEASFATTFRNLFGTPRQ